MVDPSHLFHIADYALFGATIAISLFIGVYYALSGGRQRTTSEYLVGGRKMQYLPVAISLLVSFESSIMMLGMPAEMYVYGVQMCISYWGGLLANVMSVFIMVPLLHPLQITSAYEYLHLRFDSTAVRLLGTIMGLLGNLSYTGIVLYGPAVALEAVTGFSQWYSIFLTALAAIAYTTIGGIKAVIWTDVFQAFIMYAGMFAVLIKGTIDVGSPKKVWDIAQEGGRMNFWNFDPDPTVRHTFWNLFFGAFLRSFSLVFNQSTVQRISSTESLRDAKLVLLIMAPCYFTSLTMASYEGIVAYSYYATINCDPLASKKINNPNQIIPFTVMDIFKNIPGMPGLFMASLFSASLSTMSSTLSSLSACMWADIIKPRIGKVSELKATLIAKVTVIVCGLLSCGVAILVSLIGGPLTQITSSLLSAFSGPLTGLFFLGCFFQDANAKGAMVGGIISLLFSCWLAWGKSFSKNLKKTPWLPPASTSQCLINASLTNSSFSDATSPNILTDVIKYVSYAANITHVVGQELDPPETGLWNNKTIVSDASGPQGIEAMYNISYTWQPTIGILLSVIVGIIVSISTGGNKRKKVHPRYLISFWRRFCCCLPKSVLNLCSSTDYADADNSDYVSPKTKKYLNTEFVVNANSELELRCEKAAEFSDYDEDQMRRTDEWKILPIGSDTSLIKESELCTSTPENGEILDQNGSVGKDTDK